MWLTKLPKKIKSKTNKWYSKFKAKHDSSHHVAMIDLAEKIHELGLFSPQEKRYQVTCLSKGMWTHYKTTVPKSPFKLHLDLGLSNHKQSISDLANILVKAAEAGTIYHFKFYNELEEKNIRDMLRKYEARAELLRSMKKYIENKQHAPKEIIDFCQSYLKKPFSELTKEELHMKIDDAHVHYLRRLRLAHHPVVVYLPQDVDYAKLIALCFTIENKLKDLPTNAEYLSPVDLPLLSHISFRQQKINDKYVPVFYCSESEAKELVDGALASEVYKTLLKHCQALQTPSEPKQDFQAVALESTADRTKLTI